ncbi:THO complex subunit 6 homolog [Bolinopsis microptera]|uniref:THO complex subunit 6 homolog n=1 Tax=Bolinopsis microptera TaxID=2820187 RepID=UPI00307984DD
MVVKIKPVKKESYFTHVDCIISSPIQDKLIVSTNLCKKYLVDVKSGILSCSIPSCKIPAIEDQRIYKYSEHREVYALATNSGVSICKWDNIVSSPGSIESDTSFYSVDWIGDNIISGGDNGKLIEVDGNTGTLINNYDGHSGSVNVVRKRDQNTFVSAGFDGICRIWDRRSKEVEQQFTPSSWQKAKRSKLGCHITCLDVWDDWVVCGGGPNLSLWYLKEESGIALLDMGDAVPSVVRFMPDTIVAAGNSPYLMHWGLSGKLKYKVTSKLESVKDISVNTVAREQPVLLAAGTPSDINVFLDLGYLSHTVPFLV